MRDYYAKGEWNVVCDRCGFQYKSSMLREEWTGLRVCSHCWEPRHPQTLIKVPEDNPSVPWVRPEGTDTFINIGTPLLIEASVEFRFLLAEDGSILLTET